MPEASKARSLRFSSPVKGGVSRSQLPAMQPPLKQPSEHHTVEDWWEHSPPVQAPSGA